MEMAKLLLLKPKIKIYHIIFVILLIISIVYFFTYEIYSFYRIKGVIDNKLIKIDVPITNSDTIINGDCLMINNKKYKYKVKEVGKVMLNQNNLIYQSIVIDINKKFMNNEIVDITFLYNKEMILKKIIKGE